MAHEDLTIELNESDYRRLLNILNGFSEIEQNELVSRGLRSGMRVIVQAGRTNADMLIYSKPVPYKRTGNLRKSIGQSLKKKYKSIYGGFKRPGGSPAHLVDRGTVERYTKRGFYRGKVTGNRFWTNAVMDNGDNAVRTLFDGIYDAMNKIAQRN